MPELTVEINPKPHSGQIKAHRLLNQKRFVSLCCGRRWGKTFTLEQSAMLRAINNSHRMVWWVDPKFSLAKRAYRHMKKWLPPDVIAETSATDLRMELINESVIEFQSAEKGDDLRGEGVDDMYINEASLIKLRTWKEILRPMLTDTGGSCYMAYTPKGQGHWTYEQWLRGKDKTWPAYAALHFPTAASPRIRQSEVDAAKRELPEESFRQEFLAEFLEDSSGVFKGVSKIIGGVADDYYTIPVDSPYVGGVDLARVVDWTVITILDRFGRVVWFERFNQINWKIQRERIVEVAKRYKCPMFVDQTGLGDVIVEDLREAGVQVVGIKFTEDVKRDLIHGLQACIEQQAISIPEEFEALIEELLIFQYDIGSSGKVRYEAPEGFHDDCVISLALAAKGFKERRNRPKSSNALPGLDDALEGEEDRLAA